MSNNKKFILVLVSFLVLPNILVWSAPLLENAYQNFFINDYKGTLLLIVLLSVLSPTYVLYKNNKSETPSSFWNIFSIIILIFGLLYFYIIYSLSHFGF